MGDEFSAGGVLHSILLCPIFKMGEGGSDYDGREAASVANNSGFANERIGLERTLDGLRGDELSARGLDEIFFAVGDGEESVGVDHADVAGLEPSILERVGS